MQRKAEKLPLAVLLHGNFYLSLIFVVVIGRMAFYKHRHLYFCDKFQRTLLLPTYFVWLFTEIARLYVGLKGVLLDELPATSAFLLLSFFPQTFAVLYLGFLQENALPFDKVFGCLCLPLLALELLVAWNFLRTILKRQTERYRS